MARSRYSKNKNVNGKYYSSFILDQSSFVKEPDTFEGLEVIEYVVKLGDRLDTIAARFLNEDEYWWMIALINNLDDPFPAPGTKIVIPVSTSEFLDRM